MVIKVIGVCMVLFATTIYGVALGQEYNKRVRVLEQLKRLFLLVENEISYSLEPLPDVLLNAASKCDVGEKEVKMFFEKCGERLKNEKCAELKKVWEEETRNFAALSGISGTDEDKLAALSNGLGYLDAEWQLKEINLYLDELNRQINTLKSKQKDTCRLYTGLGIMGGLFLAIVLV